MTSSIKPRFVSKISLWSAAFLAVAGALTVPSAAQAGQCVDSTFNQKLLFDAVADNVGGPSKAYAVRVTYCQSSKDPTVVLFGSTQILTQKAQGTLIKLVESERIFRGMKLIDHEDGKVYASSIGGGQPLVLAPKRQADTMVAKAAPKAKTEAPKIVQQAAAPAAEVKAPVKVVAAVAPAEKPQIKVAAEAAPTAARVVKVAVAPMPPVKPADFYQVVAAAQNANVQKPTVRVAPKVQVSQRPAAQDKVAAPQRPLQASMQASADGENFVAKFLQVFSIKLI